MTESKYDECKTELKKAIDNVNMMIRCTTDEEDISQLYEINNSLCKVSAMMSVSNMESMIRK